MKIELYYAPNACSLVPYLALTEAGADFCVRSVNLLKGEQTSPAFRRLNPKQAVPVLVVDGEPITENVAILIWIARNFPASRLLPQEPLQEVRAISFLSWCASGIHPKLTPQFLPQRYCDLPGSEDSVRRCAQKLLRGSYSIAEEILVDGRPWFFREFTVADAYFFWCFRRGTQFGMDLSGFTHCTEHFESMKRRASVVKLLAFEHMVLERFAGESPNDLQVLK